MATTTQWLDRLTHLRVDNARGNPAPHKPLLLLVVLDLAEAGQLPAHNNSINNGLALSKNAHWLFDQGLWSVTNDYRVIVAHQRFAEAITPADTFPLLMAYHGRKLHLPERSDCWPNVVHLAWHRREHAV